MKIVQQSARILVPETPMKHIERIGRICYKSEDIICEGSDRSFVEKLFKRKHLAMLEHFRFIMQVNPVVYEAIEVIDHSHIQMTHCTFDGNDRMLISFNARALMELPERCNSHHHGIIGLAVKTVVDELISHIIRKYDCYELFGFSRDKQLPLLSTGVEFIENSPYVMTKEEWMHHGWFTAHMITDRGITHEIVRHREDTSFAQESTRWCNYNTDKRGSQITVVDQGEFGLDELDDETYDIWSNVMKCAEDAYLELTRRKVKPQFARSVLPTCLKTEIAMTAPMYEWKHFFDLRLMGVAGVPHPLIKELSAEVYNKMLEVHGYVLY